MYNLDTVLSPKKASTTRENYQGQHALLLSLHITLNSVEITYNNDQIGLNSKGFLLQCDITLNINCPDPYVHTY